MFSLLAAVGKADGDSIRFNFTLGGAKVGQEVFEESPDGKSSKSIATMNLGKATTSELNMQWDGKKLVHYDVTDSDANGRLGSLTWDAGKLKVRAPKATKDLDLKIEDDVFFSNFHVQALRGLLARVRSTDEQSFEAILLEGGGKVPLKANLKTGLPYIKDGKQVVIRRYRVVIGGIEIEYVTDQNGLIVGANVPVQKFQGVAEGWDGVFTDPLAAYPELSQPTYGVKTLEGVKMKTRDGVELVADIELPDKPGKYPAILVRTPYGRKAAMLGADLYVKRGYAYIVQDVRGREDSSGEFDPFVHERQDGADTIDWVAKQDWSDGNVGMIGGSYLGYVQWAAAVEHPKALKCIIPQVSPPDAFNNLPYDQGAFMLYGSLWWLNLVKDKKTHMELAATNPSGIKNFANLPLSKLDEDVLGRKIPMFQRWLDRETMKDWKGFDHLSLVDKVKIPVLHISGWFDGDESGTMYHWERRRKAGLNNEQWLIYGPWVHGFNSKTSIGDVDYGPQSVIEIDSTYLRFFDTYLKGKQVGWDKEPKVQAFLAGANKWLTLADWPDEKATLAQKLFLSADAPANGFDGAGRLIAETPRDQEPDRYTYNPAGIKVPESLLDGNPLEQTLKVGKEDDRQDALCYRTEILSKPLSLLAPITVDLFFQSTAKDVDFFAMLFDEDEKGVKHQICQPARFRASYMGGFDRRQPIRPNHLYRANLRVWDVAYQFPKGHKMGLVITSNGFPGFARNLGTGEPIKNATRMVASSETIFHDADHPSSISFRSLKD